MPNKPKKAKKRNIDWLRPTENYPTRGDKLGKISYEQEEAKIRAFKKAKKAKSNKGMAKIRNS